MHSRWNDQDAATHEHSDLAMRVYTSRLLGADPSLVLHGGGNTSVKSTAQDFFGREVEVLYVKGSGWDLGSIEAAGFAPLRLHETKLLAERDSLTDTEMAKQLRAILLDQTAPSPSVESILHASVPHRYVDHTHTDSVVTLSNNPRGEELIAELFPDCIVLPYIMPGFILSKQVFDAIKSHNLSNYKGIVLMHHGVFTYAEDGKTAYENMIELVDRADRYITQHADQSIPPAEPPARSTTQLDASELLRFATIRRAVSLARGCAQLARLDTADPARRFANRDDLARITSRGPITPDHVIRTKRTAAILESSSDHGDDVPEIGTFVEDYERYFAKHNDGQLTMLDSAPRWAVWKHHGTLGFGSTIKDCGIIGDITRHTVWAIQTGESLGGWEALPAQDVFDLEYWILEQVKLQKPKGSQKPHLGKIAIVTGAAGGIGRAAMNALHQDGAVVVGLDLDPSITETMNAPGLLGIECDLTDEAAIRTAVEHTVAHFGGLDILVANAGIFESGQSIAELGDSWDRHLAVNLTATQRLLKHAIPFLRVGIDAAILVVGSRNCAAPGAGAAAYSVSKAGVTQLARVAALELAPEGVRVNVVHPDAVFDTGLWTPAALEASAARYGMSVEDYKAKNLLKIEIRSQDVGQLISTVAGPVFAATTGAQIPVDGGNDRVI